MSDLRSELPALSGGETPPIYYSVSLSKLTSMSIFTFGLYAIYWFYENWQHVKERERSATIPLLRAIFSILFCYSLFKRIRTTAEAWKVPRTFSPGLLTFGIVVAFLVWRLPSLYGVVLGLSGVLFLLPVQAVVNDINRAADPNFQVNEEFSKWDAGAVLIGCVFWALLVIPVILDLPE